MKFSEKEIKALSERIKPRLTEKRFSHTLSVVEAAKKIGSYFDGVDISELSAAALLHDVTKELSFDEHFELFAVGGIDVTEEDKTSLPILHSFSAPVVIRRDFPEFATDAVVSAVRKHTTGAPDMTTFDKIVFIADYVENLRTYDSCRAVRDELFTSLSLENNTEKNEYALNRAVYTSLEFTEIDILKRGRNLNSRIFDTKNYFKTLVCGKI